MGSSRILEVWCPQCGGPIHEHTAEWRCARCDLRLPAFRNGQRRDADDIEREIHNIAAEIGGADRTDRKQSGPSSLGRCPRCGSAVVEMPDRYACEKSVAGVGACKFRINKTILSQPLDGNQVQRLLTSGKTDLLTGFVSKSGRQFPAFLVIDETGKITFEFPAKAEQQPTQPPHPTTSLLRGTRPARILLLDDEPFVTDAMKLMLQFYFKDYRLAECRTGDEGWAEISRESPDLLITDYGHPGMRLEEMLPRLARRPAKFPIIISSAYVSGLPDLQARLLSHRGLTIKLLNKPFLAEDLGAKVLECLTVAPSGPESDSGTVDGAQEETPSEPSRNPGCKPLLSAATPAMFRKNAFRVTGLPVEATTRQVAKHAANLGQMAELGLEASHQAGLFAIKPPPTLDEVREAVQRLKDPENRLIDELFWFWPCHPGSAISDPGLEALTSGNGDTALKAWEAAAANPATASAAAHNTALFWHLTAIDAETKLASNAGAQNQQELETPWRTCLAEWGRLVDDDELWERVATHARRIDDPRLKASLLRNMRATLPLALAKINAELALSHAESGRTALATMHVNLVRDSDRGGPLLEKAAEIVLTPLIGRLRESIRRAKETTQEDPDKGADAVRHLLAHAKQLPDIFDLFYGEQEHSAKEVLDEAATTCTDSIVSYQKKTGDNQTFVELLKQTLPLADAAEVRQRIEKNIDIGRNNLAYSEAEQIRRVCETAAKAAEADPGSADKQAKRILSTAPEVLSMLSASELPAEILERLQDEVALAAMHCAVMFGNATEKWEPCIRILDESLGLAVSPDARRRISENLATVRRNRTLYGGLTSISSTPSLSTINGIGLTLYGCTDHDPATGSYLATYYFVVLFVPIFPICRYRVTRNGNAYRFFGKAPLRAIDKWHIAVSISLIVAAVLAMGSSATSTSSPPASYTPNFNYTPPIQAPSRSPTTPSIPAAAPATFTPATLPSSPATPEKRTYGIPSTASAELQSAKDQIALEKAKAEALDTKLAAAKQALEAQRSQVEDLRTRLDTLSAQIERDRIYLDRSSQSDIDDFNAKVGRYNTLLRTVRAENGTANEMVDSYNTLLEVSKAQDRVVNQLIDNYNAKLSSYGR